LLSARKTHLPNKKFLKNPFFPITGIALLFTGVFHRFGALTTRAAAKAALKTVLPISKKLCYPITQALAILSLFFLYVK
jgi:hypothetical protein